MTPIERARLIFIELYGIPNEPPTERELKLVAAQIEEAEKEAYEKGFAAAQADQCDLC